MLSIIRQKSFIALLLTGTMLYAGSTAHTHRSLETIEDPDGYTKEGYCVVTTVDQILLGLSRFHSEKAFAEKCNGKMIFRFGKTFCTMFVSYRMHFPVLLSDQNGTYYFDVNSSKEVCGKTITEELVKQPEASHASGK